MRLLRMLPERHQKLLRELTAFGFAGTINTLLGLAIFNILLGLGSYTATVISTAVATASSFLMNRHVTYGSRPRTPLRRELPLFVTFNLVGLGIQLGVLAFARFSFDLHDTDRLELNIARFAGVAIGTVFLLLTYRTFVFRAHPATPAVADATGSPAVVFRPHPAAPAAADATGSPAVFAPSRLPDASAGGDDFAELTDPLEAELAERMLYGELLGPDLDDEAVRSAL